MGYRIGKREDFFTLLILTVLLIAAAGSLLLKNKPQTTHSKAAEIGCTASAGGWIDYINNETGEIRGWDTESRVDLYIEGPVGAGFCHMEGRILEWGRISC